MPNKSNFCSIRSNSRVGSPSLCKQQGVTLISFFIYVLFGAIVLTGCLKILPVYMENMKLQSILNSVSENFATSSSGATKTGIKEKLSKRFIIDSVKAVPVKDIKIERDGEFWLVDAGYEKRVPIFRNIDVVVNFTETNRVQIANAR